MTYILKAFFFNPYFMTVLVIGLVGSVFIYRANKEYERKVKK